MRGPSFVILAMLLAGMPLCSSCGRDDEAVPASEVRRPPRLVILFAPCTVNRRYLSPYAPDVPYTPALSRLAGEAVVFDEHVTEIGLSGAAYASILSGTDARRHGIFMHPKPLADSLLLISEAYERAGYDTYGWLAHQMASGRLHYGQGIDPDKTFARRLRAADPIFGAILSRLLSDPTYRAFLVTTFTVSHRPYAHGDIEDFCETFPAECDRLPAAAATERYLRIFRRNHARLAYNFEATVAALGLSKDDVRELRAVVDVSYAASIHALDRAVGEVIDVLRAHDLLEDTLFAFTADHGEVIGTTPAEFPWTHSVTLQPDVLEVPLIVHAPGLAAGRFRGLTRSVDVFPTMASLSAVPIDDYDGPGVDLAPALRGEEPPPDIAAFSHTDVYPAFLPREFLTEVSGKVFELFAIADPRSMWVSMRRGSFTYKLEGTRGNLRPVLYDRVHDPKEMRNLYEEVRTPEIDAAFATLREYRRALIAAYQEGVGAEPAPAAEQLEGLRALGYVE